MHFVTTICTWNPHITIFQIVASWPNIVLSYQTLNQRKAFLFGFQMTNKCQFPRKNWYFWLVLSSRVTNKESFSINNHSKVSVHLKTTSNMNLFFYFSKIIFAKALFFYKYITFHAVSNVVVCEPEGLQSFKDQSAQQIKQSLM